MNFGLFAKVLGSSMERANCSLFSLFSSFKYGLSELECRRSKPSLNNLCRELLLTLRAFASDLMVPLLFKGISTTLVRSTWIFLRPQFLGIKEFTFTGMSSVVQFFAVCYTFVLYAHEHCTLQQ
jgi:hypothetical protein